MRIALSFLVLAGLLALVWWMPNSSQETAHVSVVSAQASDGPVPGSVVLAPLEVEQAAPVPEGEAPPRPAREAATEDVWPTGYGQLVVRVLQGGRPTKDLTVTLSDAGDIVFGEGEERLKKTTDGRGQVAYYVRPTRTVTVGAVDEARGWRSQSDFTTPFEGRSRIVDLEIGVPPATGVLMQVVSEVDGLPLDGVTIEVTGLGDLASSTVSTNAEGEVKLPVSPVLGYELSLDRFVAKELTAADVNQGQKIVIPLRPLARVYGKLDLEGVQFAKGAKVMARWAKAAERSDSSNVVFDLDVRSSGSVIPSSMTQSVPVLSDGSWSIDLTVPEDADALRDVVVELHFTDRTRRQLVTINQVRPGDEIAVPDPWQRAGPVKIVFTGPSTRELVNGATLRLSQTSVEDARGSAELSRHIWRHEDVRLGQLPVGQWYYVVVVDGMAKGDQPQGQFFRAAADEEIAIDWQGTVLTVSVEQEDDRVAHRYAVGLARPGELPTVTASIMHGRRRVLPLPEAPTGYDVVLMTASFSRSSFNLSASGVEMESQPPEEILRVPLGMTTRSLVLRP